jgi:deoxyribodipyrimidine photo-lyase
LTGYKRRAAALAYNRIMIQEARVRHLNNLPSARGRYVLYWMQASQRTRFNHALEYAIARANELRQPVVVCFGLMDDYPEANLRHYAFMLEGLSEVERALAERGISLVIRRGRPQEVAIQLAENASLVVCDRGYLRHQKQWRDYVADNAGREVVEIESDVVVPVDEASNHAEFAARTIRPKIHKLLARYLLKLPMERVRLPFGKISIKSDIDLSDVPAVLHRLKIDRSVPPSGRFKGGQNEGRKLLAHFLRSKLSGYDEESNDPADQNTSTLGAYLHFGQLSPVEVALAVENARAPRMDRDSYLEQLIVRRELAVNFVNFNPRYDSFDGLPAWARQTLKAHRADKRDYIYTREQLESAATDDPYWNAAQKEMLFSGYMHNYMRMYWGKKILEWKRTPREAFEDALYLNNKYFLCGRDPNSYASIGWLFGLHDRPWSRRPIFGTVRYMNSAGLERKFDMDRYVRMVDELQAKEE